MSYISSRSSVRHASGKKILVRNNQITYRRTNFLYFIFSFLPPTSVVFLKFDQINYLAPLYVKAFSNVNDSIWRYFSSMTIFHCLVEKNFLYDQIFAVRNLTFDNSVYKFVAHHSGLFFSVEAFRIYSSHNRRNVLEIFS